MSTTITTPTIQQLHAEWTEFYHLARYLVRRKLMRLDGSMPPDIDDRVDDAIAHAWRLYPKLRQRKPELPPRTAIRWVCKTGVSRVWARTRFVTTKPHPGYVDAMDSKATREGYFEDSIPGAAASDETYRDPSDRANVEQLIDTLPTHLQPVARLLSYGSMTKALVAERRGISKTTLYAQLDEIRKALS
jgi:DNA-directed RNA polymerase specialized sigma24 family protein